MPAAKRILNMADAPDDPIARVIWLGGVHEQAEKELADAFAAAYFEARLQRRLDSAVEVGPHSRKRVLAFTRAENQRRGRSVRWGDGADITSTAYDGM
jgi:hypothetical protein